MQPLNWREKFAGIFTLFFGILILALFILDNTSSQSADVSYAGGKIQISKGALFQTIRSVIALMIAIIGGITLLKGKRIGWIMSFAFLLFIMIISGYYTVLTGMLVLMGPMIASSIVSFFSLISIIFLLITSTRQKFRVSSKTILPTLVFLMAIGAVFFFLQ